MNYFNNYWIFKRRLTILPDPKSQIGYGCLLALCGFILLGCTTKIQDQAPSFSVDETSIPDAKPIIEPRSRYGNPTSYQVDGTRYHPMSSSTDFQETGYASWYGTKFDGQLTSSREPYDMLAMTAAHRTLPLPTYLRVKNCANGKTVIVRVNDRGPFAKDRILDLSYVAAKKLGMLKKGTAWVHIQAIDPHQQVETIQEDGLLHYIQVGQFKDEHTAKDFASSLEISIQPVATIHQGDQWVVVIGPMQSKDLLPNLIQYLNDQGYHNLKTLNRPLTAVKT